MTTLLRHSLQLQIMINLLGTRFGVVHPGAWWIWCSLSLPGPLSLFFVHSFSLPCKTTFPSQGQLLYVTVSGSYRSQFPFCRDNKVHALQKGAPSFLVYSNYPVCPPINTLDQSSLGKLKGEKKRNQRAEKDRKRCGRRGRGGCRKWQSKQEKKSMWEGRDKWRCEIWRKTWQGEERASWEKGWKRQRGWRKCWIHCESNAS